MTRIVARASRYGGEHVVGTITQEQGHFWLEMGEALFTRCVHSLGVGWGGDVDDAWNIPERLRVPEFYDIDDLVHLNAPEFADQNVIEFAKVVGDEEETLGELELGSDDLVAREEETPRYEGDGVVVYAQHFVKGAFETAFEIEGDAFDVSRVRLRVARLSDLRLVVVQVRSIQTFFTHRPVLTLDRVSFQLTDEHFLYGMALSLGTPEPRPQCAADARCPASSGIARAAARRRRRKTTATRPRARRDGRRGGRMEGRRR